MTSDNCKGQYGSTQAEQRAGSIFIESLSVSQKDFIQNSLH